MRIIVEEIEGYGIREVVGFTEDGQVSFLHLTKEEFRSAEYIGETRLIAQMISEFYQRKKCPLCETGNLVEMVMDNNGVDCYYYVCSSCGGEVVDTKLLKKNKKLIQTQKH